MAASSRQSRSAWGLGIDAGGTRTRWALASTSGELVAEGSLPGLSALQVTTRAGQQAWREALGAMAGPVLAAGRPLRVHAGITGYGGGREPLAALIGTPLGLAADAITLCSDVEIGCLDAFGPGEGYLLHAGTGAIAAYIDAQGQLHRVGGRGSIVDDAGSGYWIARRALRTIWRREDEAPGAWPQSALAREVFEHVGGTHWDDSRAFVYGADRGEIGKLALAVAAAAATDPVALQLLQQAGHELARLAHILVQRFGPRPVALAGRVFDLHPAIEQACRAGLPRGVAVQRRHSQAQRTAARLAARAPAAAGAGVAS
ncbi:MAG: ATPase [Rubrivivax sp. SCN 71-131]|nr:MAG: ATPase [Rubrivivax sp. SCN 71-131]